MNNKNIDNLDELIKEISALIKNPNNLYRGYKNDKELLPNIMRSCSTDYKSEAKKIIEEFIDRCKPFYSATNVMDVLACAQHYGLKTQLLDFSSNPYVALYFSIFHTRKTDETYRIIYFDKNDAKKIEIDSVISASGETLMIKQFDFKAQYEGIINQLKEDKLNYCQPTYSNTRLLMQQGSFVIVNQANEEILKEILDKNASTITIGDSIREEAIKYLRAIGIDGFHLMPDLSGICYAINNHEFE